MTEHTSTGVPIVIAALHLPKIQSGKKICMPQIEDYALTNMGLFANGGVPAVILQDQSLNASNARLETIAMMASVGRLIHEEYNQVELGIIVEAHDPFASLAIAQACGATFVRLKVFVGAMLKSSGLQQGCGVQALDYRNSIGRNDIRIFADVHDRTGLPLLDMPLAQAAGWAVKTGADALILTGSTFDDSLEFLRKVRTKEKLIPLIMGGNATVDNVQQALEYADGIIVSSSLKKEDATPEDLIQWDLEKIKRFMEAVNQAESNLLKEKR